MTFRNPWIDPRIVLVRVAAARSYLLQRHWKPLVSELEHLEPFESPTGDAGPIVHVPLLEGGRDYSQRVIELITEIALAEGRYAVEVLNDVLAQATHPVQSNGSSAEHESSATVK